MFTGIITHITKIEAITLNKSHDVLLEVSLPSKQITRKLVMGCSIALNGICLTLIAQKKLAAKTLLSFQASEETCSKTNLRNWKKGDEVNLEFALRMGDELGGHMVLGHVDDCAKITEIRKIKGSRCFVLSVQKKWEKFLMAKGSVVLDGVSLTVNEVFSDKKIVNFQVNIIPHTFENTGFKGYKIGDLVNLEIDVLARYAINSLKK
jgi:riboflavin synthase